MTHRSDVSVGIIANPASGRDIRRLTAKATVFPTVEKANMIQRVLSALGAVGIGKVLMMPDMTGIAAAVSRAIVSHAAEAAHPWPAVEFIQQDIRESVTDTFTAVEAMKSRGVSVIVVLGGDGTHRAVAMRAEEIPLATLSTGTNNAFPDLREATTTGFAAGLVARGYVPDSEACNRNKRIEVRAGERIEVALVDVCITRHLHVASRALWQAESLAELFVAFAEPDSVGLSSIAGLLQPVSRAEEHGLRIRFCEPGEASARSILAPIAPGLLTRVRIAAFGELAPDRLVRPHGSTGTVALDGEREIEFGPGDEVSVKLDWAGPRTIDVGRTLGFAAQRGLLDM